MTSLLHYFFKYFVRYDSFKLHLCLCFYIYTHVFVIMFLKLNKVIKNNKSMTNIQIITKLKYLKFFFICK